MKKEAMGLIIKKEDGSEIINYDNPAFPSYIYDGWIVPKVTWEKVPHFHEDIEILTVKSGRMAYSVGGKTILLNAGDTIVVNANQIHYSMAVEENVCRYVIFVVHPSILISSLEVEMQAVRPVLENAELPYIRFRGYNEYTEEMYRLMLGMPEIRRDAFAVTKEFFKIWDIIRKQADNYGGNEEEITPDPQMNTFKIMLNYISEHYKENVKLSDIADRAHISKSMCNNLFKRYVNESPISYLSHLRSRKVAEYLRSTPMTLAEIAEETGFGGVSYMAETFRKYFDNSPAAYRKEWNKMTSEAKGEKE